MKFPSLNVREKRYVKTVVVLIAVLGLTVLISTLAGLSIPLILLISGITLGFSVVGMMVCFKLFAFFSSKKSDIVVYTDDPPLRQTKIRSYNDAPNSEVTQRNNDNLLQASYKKKEYVWPISSYSEEDIRRFNEIKKLNELREIRQLSIACDGLIRKASKKTEEQREEMEKQFHRLDVIEEKIESKIDKQCMDEMRKEIQAIHQQAEQNFKYSEENSDFSYRCTLL